MRVMVEDMRRKLRGQKHAVSLECRCIAHQIGVLLRCLEVAVVQGEGAVSDSR